MPVSRGEIVEINFPLPGGPKPHPAIVISNDDINKYEDMFIAVMISGKPNLDDYSYDLTDEMLTKKPKKRSQVRCHLLTLVTEDQVINKHGIVKKQYLEEIVDKICSAVLSS